MKRAAVVGVVMASIAGVPSGCQKRSESAGSGGGPPPAPVRVVTAERRELPLEIRTIGSAESLAVVTVRPQLDGMIVGTPLVEGGEVKAGDVLVRLDPRPFEAALHEAEARLESGRAHEADARRALGQLETALQGRAVSERERDKAQADASALAADVRMWEAAVETARLRLAYCTITSPISGRAGLIKVKAGNVVKENETEIAQISQVDPIGVTFSIPEQSLGQVRRLMKEAPLRVDALASGDDGEPVSGEVTFLDNQVDPSTGTIRLRANFANADRRLWPGQFVRVTLRLTVERDVIVIPEQAVQTGQKGKFVYVVRDGVAEMRDVTVSRNAGGMAAVTGGIEPGEVVVTEGQLRLLPGARVQLKTDAAAGG